MQDLASRRLRWLSLPQGSAPGRADGLWMLALATVFVVWATRAFPWIGFHEIHPDEGHLLARAALWHAGHGAQAGAWDGLSLLLTHALSALQWVAPWDVPAARALVLASAVLLLVSLYALIGRLHGRAAALWSVALLMTAPAFVRLSVTVVPDLPSVALAVAALAAVVVPRWPLGARVALGGALFALALQTRGSGALLAPALLLAVLASAHEGGRRAQGRALAGAMAAGLAALAAVAVVPGGAFRPDGAAFFGGLLAGDAAPPAANAQAALAVLRSNAVVGGAGVLGLLLVVAGPRRGWATWLPVVALAVPAAALVLHTPAWDTQGLLLLVPLAWLGGLVADRIVAGLWSAGPKGWRVAAALAGTALVVFCVQQAWRSRGPEPQAEAKRVLQEQILAARPGGGWMVTDAPIDAFRAGYLVPPELVAHLTQQRRAGAPKADPVIQAVERWRPEQLAFRRIKLDPSMVAGLGQRYLKVFEHRQFSHWLPYPVRASGAQEQAVRQRLDQLLDGFAATAINGAFAGVITQDGLSRYGEAVTEPIGSESAFMRPPGSTPRIGACYLQAHRVTGEPRHRDTARLAAGAVMRAQTCQGGWLSASALEPRCGMGEVRDEPGIALDEGLTAQAIGFLMDLQAIEPDKPRRDRLQASITRALDYLVDKQNGHGAWPLSFGRMSYAAHSTINDDLTTSHVRILLRAQATYDEPRYRKAALRGIEFLLRTQSTRGGWAQQYNERLEPAGARRHEPAALSSLETAHVLHTLLYARTVLDDPRLQPALDRGARWLERSAIGVNRWARFYDLKRNRPLYVDPYGAMHRTLDALPADRRDSYRWEGRFPEVVSALALVRAAGQGDEALALARQRVSLVQRLEHQREARAWLAQHADEAQPVLADGKGLIWAKDVIQRCDQLLSLLR